MSVLTYIRQDLRRTRDNLVAASIQGARVERTRAGSSIATNVLTDGEFPTLDDATRTKCGAPPFTDTYVAEVRYAN